MFGALRAFTPASLAQGRGQDGGRKGAELAARQQSRYAVISGATEPGRGLRELIRQHFESTVAVCRGQRGQRLHRSGSAETGFSHRSTGDRAGFDSDKLGKPLAQLCLPSSSPSAPSPRRLPCLQPRRSGVPL